MVGVFRAAKYLLLAYAAALAAEFLCFGLEADAVVLLVPIFYAWRLGPVLFAALCARLSKSVDEAAAFLMLEIVLLLWSALAWYALTIVHPHSMNGIGLFVVIPFWQYVVFTAAWLIALAAGWRPRRDWPEPEAAP
jgi:hypothetical protein